MATSFFGHTVRPSSTCKTPERRAKSRKEMALYQCLLRFQVHRPSADVDLPQSAARIHFPHSRQQRLPIHLVRKRCSSSPPAVHIFHEGPGRSNESSTRFSLPESSASGSGNEVTAC